MIYIQQSDLEKMLLDFSKDIDDSYLDNLCIKLNNTRRYSRLVAKYVIDKDIYNNIDYSKSKEGFIDVIDMFSGCGGMSIGFKLVSHLFPSYRLVTAIDIDENANKTYEKNFGISPIQMDIKNLLENEDVFNDFVKKYRSDLNKPLVLIGCAPCQGFSSHRKREKKKDERNSLVEVFAKVAVRLNPTFIIMENVPELLSKKHWEHFSAFKEVLVDKGYYVRAQIVNTAEYGVPQERYRALVIASKREFFMPTGFLSKNEFNTVRKAIGELPPIEPGKPHKDDLLHVTSKHHPSTIEIISQVPKDGGNRPKHIGPNWYHDVYGRLSWDKPSVTITTCARNPASGRYVHPEQNRGLSMREVALLQSFPKHFDFVGNLGSIYTQIGNAVPPRFSIYLAIHILGELLSEDIPANVYEDDKKFDIDSPIPNSFASIVENSKKKEGMENE